MTASSLPLHSLEQIFLKARTHIVWKNQSIDDHLLQKIYDLAKMGPTSANCSPMRIIFIKSKEAKERLKPCLSPGNVEKTMTAPATAIIAQDMYFYDQLPKLFPHEDARSWFIGNEQLINDTAFRNSSLQGAYFIIAARAMGLDCGPMSGFDTQKLNQEFFPDGHWKANFLCNLGHGDEQKLYPRSPRLKFEEACKIL
ncbi:MAG: malonic semialdehyde reductase [Alphaproteobacteria bacterium]|nr:malonic semialdehyde reductase [Alphaproteobacteria bacterium]